MWETLPSKNSSIVVFKVFLFVKHNFDVTGYVCYSHNSVQEGPETNLPEPGRVRICTLGHLGWLNWIIMSLRCSKEVIPQVSQLRPSSSWVRDRLPCLGKLLIHATSAVNLSTEIE